MMSEQVSAEDLAFCAAVLDGLTQEWVRFGRPLPRTVPQAREILDRALKCAMSLERQQIQPMEEDLSENIIGSSEVAELLGVSRRTAQRRGKELGVPQISGSFVFDRNELGA